MPREKPDQDPPPATSGRRVTLRDIAKKMGISHATVSLALRNSAQVSAAMRDKVQKTAKKMNYQPDPMLSALAQYRLSSQDRPAQATLAWINPLRAPANIRKQKEFDLYWAGAQDAARRLGFQLEEFRTKDIPLQRMESVFKARNIQGLIIAGMLPLSFHDETIDWQHFDWKAFAIVRFGRKTTHPQAHFVTSAQTTNTIMAFNRITEKGYQRIGFVGEYTEARVFCAGFLFAQLAIPEDRRMPPLFFNEEELSHQENAKKLKSWIRKYQPDAILTDRAYLLQTLDHIDYRVPDDIGVATTSMHDTPINAGINQNPEEIGRAAVRMLTAQLNQNEFGIPSVRNETLIEGHWVDGSMLPDRC
jgi:DNA-binding LacI/PurR family transcriptional regulator